MTDKIEKIIKEAGAIMLSAKDEAFSVSEKEGNINLVTEYDIKVQRFLEEKFKNLFPASSFLAEEEGQDKGKVKDGITFVIDPIDGTVNFAFGMDESCISVAILKDKEVFFGAVYNPYKDEYFMAEKGKGAYLNGKMIRVSDKDAAFSLVGLGTSPYYKENIGKETIMLFSDLFYNFGDVRRVGSAALDLCYVAKGAYSAFFEMILSPWDYAAGALIVKEAGGVVTDFSGKELKYEKSSVLAASEKVYDKALSLVYREN